MLKFVLHRASIQTPDLIYSKILLGLRQHFGDVVLIQSDHCFSVNEGRSRVLGSARSTAHQDARNVYVRKIISVGGVLSYTSPQR